ncbi:MAG: hypothetical protein Q8P89_00700 [bacterium]|nr:hypothetical protein [bacterium]
MDEVSQPVPIVGQPQPQSTPPASSVKSSRWLKIIIIVGVIVLVSAAAGAAVYLFAKRSLGGVVCTQEAKQCPGSSYVSRTGPNCAFAPCPGEQGGVTPTSDPTANWETHSFAKFSFKYPPNWDLQDCGVPNAIYLDDDMVNCAAGWANIIIGEAFDADFAFEKSKGTLIDERKISLGGKDVLQGDIDLPDEPLFTETRVKIGDTAYGFSLYSNEPPKRAIYDQILSTFKFLDQEQSPSESPHSAMSWAISSGTNVEFLVTSPSGQQEGYLAVSNSYVRDLPDAYYGVEGGIVDMTGQGPPILDALQFGQNNPENGIYTLQIFGKQPGAYHLEVAFAWGPGDGKVDSIDGTLTTNQVDKYTVTIPSGAIQKVGN